mgnify:CR=1 FL=1
MIRHVAMFKWNDEVTEAHVRAASTALDGLPEVIDALLDYRHGPDLGLVDGNFDYVVVADVADEAGFFAYRDHPAHQAFITGFIAGHVAQRCAVQYRLD